MSHLDLDAAGLSEWKHPRSSGEADLGSQQRLAAAIICQQLALSSEYDSECSRMRERKLERQMEDLHKVGMLVAALMKSEAVG